jgi:hypothetical protein
MSGPQDMHHLTEETGMNFERRTDKCDDLGLLEHHFVRERRGWERKVSEEKVASLMKVAEDSTVVSRGDNGVGWLIG